MGYIGHGIRSERSQMAINDYIVPLSLINRSLVEEVLDYLNIELNEKITIRFIKDYLKEEVVPEWHHTGSYFNKTDHYDLEIGLREISQLRYEEIDKRIHLLKKDKPKKGKNEEEILYATFAEDVWEGSRNYPKLNTYYRVGVKKGDWIYMPNNKKASCKAQKNHSFEFHKTLRRIEGSDELKKELKKIYLKFKKGENK